VNEVASILTQHETLIVKYSVLKAEHEQSVDELKEFQGAVSDIKLVRERDGWSEGERALTVKIELERIVQSLSDEVGDKDMQIQTLREVNKSLVEQFRSKDKK